MFLGPILLTGSPSTMSAILPTSQAKTERWGSGKEAGEEANTVDMSSAACSCGSIVTAWWITPFGITSSNAVGRSRNQILMSVARTLTSEVCARRRREGGRSGEERGGGGGEEKERKVKVRIWLTESATRGCVLEYEV